MIKASTLAETMEAVLTVCPPYESPGTTKLSSILSGAGCDCSGVPCAIFAKHGLTLYHGSNTIARKYLTSREKLVNSGQLAVGMAVFKHNNNGGEPSKYRTDGLGDFHHIGIVTSVKPLRIVHQSSSAMHTACDTSIKKWQYFGLLKGVQYDEDVPASEQSQQEGEPMNVIYKVQINTDKLRIRAEDSTESAVIGSLKRGNVVECSYKAGGWLKLADQEGWISERYVKILSEEEEDIDDQVVDEPADEDTDDDAWMTVLKRLDAIEARLDALEG